MMTCVSRTSWKPDETFYPSPTMATRAPAETLAYVATFQFDGADQPNALAVVDLDPQSAAYGCRVYWTNSLYGAWDDDLYPEGVGAWMAKADVDPENGGMVLDETFFPHGEDFRGNRVHQVRLQGGDSSSDSYCFR
ncbi:hypothetical protein CYJ76_08470 [Kytococcus schroeteri]|uniref:Uncharacterized protein n=1 Tax=Kytococcus schroeteri TaxID=138300 RepID=A0A2I1P9L8_9MICO|nr:hypothetical protein CYJ76_08470 [Kytococcus schroeteri]